jgi:hypothetical protein
VTSTAALPVATPTAPPAIGLPTNGGAYVSGDSGAIVSTPAKTARTSAPSPGDRVGAVVRAVEAGLRGAFGVLITRLRR